METKIDSNVRLQLTDKVVLTIGKDKPNAIALTLLLVLSLISISIPIGGLVYLASLSNGIPFGFVLACAIFMLVFGYLIRLYLWNKYGKEVFIIDNGALNHFFDYRYFKDNQKSYSYGSIAVCIIRNSKVCQINPSDTDVSDDDLCTNICFQFNGNLLISKDVLPVKLIRKVAKELSEQKGCSHV